MQRLLNPLLFLACVALSLSAAYAADVPVCRADNDQREPAFTTDGAGGAIVTWIDFRDFSDDIYAQRVDAAGNVLWALDGVPVAVAADNQRDPDICPDGEGGAIITWYDTRSGTPTIYAQRIDPNGNPLWAQNGIPITTTGSFQEDPKIVEDGYGGAIVCWRDYRSAEWDIWAQRLSPDGDLLWGVNGKMVCVTAGTKFDNEIVTDGFGGAVITWTDPRATNSDIYAQRLDYLGNGQWTVNGVPVCAAANSQSVPKLIPDGSGGAIITWNDFRTGSHYDIYAQWIDLNGVPMWTVDGEPVCTRSGHQDYVEIATDGAGGAIIAWKDESGIDFDVYAQRIDAAGAPMWTLDGISVCTLPGYQYYPVVAPDGSGGAFIAWKDDRIDPGHDIYFQRIDADSNAYFDPGGIVASSVPGSQNYPQLMAYPFGGAFVIWEDYRGADKDIYLQHIEEDGFVGFDLAPSIHAVRDVPGDEGGCVTVAWDASRLDPLQTDIVVNYSIWRSLDLEAAMALMGSGALLIESAADMPKEPGLELSAAKPVIRVSQSATAAYYWELVDNQDALYLESYSKTIPTLFDSTAVSPDLHYFQIIAHSADPHTFWTSEPAGGYSVDNLAPRPPLGLAAEQIISPAGLEITWHPNTEADLGGYVIHRGVDAGFTPDGGNIIYSDSDTLCFDSEWRWNSPYWYKVAAVDIHGNASGYVLLGPDDVTGEEVPDTPPASYLSQNYPNPFNPTTTIRFGLTARAAVSLRIYDAAGRLVRVLVDEHREAGRYAEDWEGLDNSGRAVASGVYFYRLQAGAFEETKKMVLLR